MFIDISMPIDSNSIPYPDDPNTNIRVLKRVKEDGYFLTKYSSSLHTGTHIDFPAHFIDEGKMAYDYPLERFYGPLSLIDVRGKDVIYPSKEFDCVNNNDIVILYTGYEDLYPKKEYFSNHPILSKEAALFFIERKISLLGADLPSFDNESFEIHRLLLSNDILIGENFTNLARVHRAFLEGKKLEAFMFPLKISAEASQVRALVKVI